VVRGFWRGNFPNRHQAVPAGATRPSPPLRIGVIPLRCGWGLVLGRRPVWLTFGRFWVACPLFQVILGEFGASSRSGGVPTFRVFPTSKIGSRSWRCRRLGNVEDYLREVDVFASYLLFGNNFRNQPYHWLAGATQPNAQLLQQGKKVQSDHSGQ